MNTELIIEIEQSANKLAHDVLAIAAAVLSTTGGVAYRDGVAFQEPDDTVHVLIARGIQNVATARAARIESASPLAVAAVACHALRLLHAPAAARARASAWAFIAAHDKVEPVRAALAFVEWLELVAPPAAREHDVH